MADFPDCLDVLQADLAAMRRRKSSACPPSPPLGAAALMRRRPVRSLRSRAVVALWAVQEAKGLTLVWLAAACELKVESMRNWLFSGVAPNPENAARIEKNLGIPVAWWRELPSEEGRHAEP